MPTELEGYIKSLKASHNAVFELAEAAVPDAVTYPQFIAGDPASDELWVEQLETEAGVIFCIQVFFDGLSQTDPAPVKMMDPLLPVAVLVYVEDFTGVDSINAQLKMLETIATLQWNINASTDLGMSNIDDEDVRGCVAKHRGLKFPSFRTKRFSRKSALWCQGRIEVELNSRPLRT